MPSSTPLLPLAWQKTNAHEELEKWLRWKTVGVSSDTIYRWIDKHAMPAHRMGRLWKFKKYEVDSWVKAGGAADKSDRPSNER